MANRIFERGESTWIPVPPYAVPDIFANISNCTESKFSFSVVDSTVYNTNNGSTSYGIIVSGANREKNEGIEGQRAVRAQPT